MIEAMVINTAMDADPVRGARASADRNRDAGRPDVEDPVAGGLSYRKLILGAQVLSRKLKEMTTVGENVGVLLPNANGVAATFFALQSIGRVPAMLNFSAGAVKSARPAAPPRSRPSSPRAPSSRKAELRRWSRRFKPTLRIVYLEELRETVGSSTSSPDS